MFFVGNTIYSYVTGFPIATLVGKNNVMICDLERACSMTTRKHIDYVRWMCVNAHKNLVWCENPLASPEDNVLSMLRYLDFIVPVLINQRTAVIAEDVVVTLSPGEAREYSWIRKTSDITHLAKKVEKLHTLLNSFKLRTKLKKRCGRWLSGKDNPWAIARREIIRIIQVRMENKKAKKVIADVRNNLRRAERRKLNKERHKKLVMELQQEAQPRQIITSWAVDVLEEEDFDYPQRVIHLNKRQQSLYD